ncbi:outer membrane protein assembly factor BamD, partial [Pseudomonas sp. BGM005]|nr:outer membrane protein assembly factor BamD [Pseudomonas sp. BG5]
MMKTARALFASLLVLSAGASISGCQSDPDIDITKLGLETDPPDVLYTQGLANMKA